MSDTIYQAKEPPKCDVKGNRSFEMWMMKFKAWLHNVGYGAVLTSEFDATLPAIEGTILELTKLAD